MGAVEELKVPLRELVESRFTDSTQP